MKNDEGNKSRVDFPIAPGSYKWLVAGCALVLIGFLLMSGGGSDNPEVFNEEIFSFRRITLAPIVVIAGFVLVGVGIMRKPKA